MGGVFGKFGTMKIILSLVSLSVSLFASSSFFFSFSYIALLVSPFPFFSMMLATVFI